MSRILVDQIRSNSASADAMTLDGSGNVTFPANATCSGTATGFGGGKVLQVVSATKTDTTTSTASSYTDIPGLAVSITPSATSSKCLIIVSLHGTGDSNTQWYTEIYRTSDNSSICIGDASSTRVRHSLGTAYYHQGNHIYSMSQNFLDSPNTTSAFTYKLRLRNQAGGQMTVNMSNQDYNGPESGRNASTITVMEIGA